MFFFYCCCCGGGDDDDGDVVVVVDGWLMDIGFVDVFVCGCLGDGEDVFNVWMILFLLSLQS